MIRDPIACHNERVKLFAGFLNAIGLGLIGFALLRPLTENLDNATLASMFWALTGLVLHACAHYVMKYIVKEIQA